MDDPKESNVVELHYGMPIAQPGYPNEDVVAVCEDLLERARSGDICGVTVVRQHSDGAISGDCAGHRDRLKTIGEMVQHIIYLSSG